MLYSMNVVFEIIDAAIRAKEQIADDIENTIILSNTQAERLFLYMESGLGEYIDAVHWAAYE